MNDALVMAIIAVTISAISIVYIICEDIKNDED